MKNTLNILLLLVLSLYFFSCEKETQSTPEIPIAQLLIGEWQVIYQKNKQNDFTFQDYNEGVVTEWGCFYIESIKIDKDGSFYINDSHIPIADSSIHAMGGFWELNPSQDSITFSCREGDSKIHEVTFTIYTDKAGLLILENETLQLKHHKKL